jgi:hypothetical protein
MPVRKTPVWRVSSGNHTKWFWEERDARQYAKDRYEIDLDGIPFVAELTDREMIAHLNNLEARPAV